VQVFEILAGWISVLHGIFYCARLAVAP